MPPNLPSSPPPTSLALPSLFRANINPRRECWFIVDTKWLQSWAKFVRGEGPPPGRISNESERVELYCSQKDGGGLCRCVLFFLGAKAMRAMLGVISGCAYLLLWWRTSMLFFTRPT